jgi:hypothetical protein
MKTQIVPLSPATQVPEDTQDRWLDRTVRRRSATVSFWYAYVNYPRRWSKQFWRFLQTTPGKMTAMVVSLSLIILLAGLSMSQVAADRRSEFDQLINNTEPVSYMAQNLYSSLSYANTAASSGFVMADTPNTEFRTDYATEYQKAGRAIAFTSSGIADRDSEEMQLVTELSQKLPIYTGLVETAWANNRQANPVGVAYMSDASSLMRKDLLPTASQLYTLTSANVAEQQRALTVPAWRPIVGLAVALIALVLAQFWLAAITNRRLNKGMLTAFALMVVATFWVVTVNALTWQAGSEASIKATEPLENLTNARISAQQARTQEMLALVWRESLEGTNRTFAATSTSIKETLATFDNPTAREAEKALQSWHETHDAIVEKLNAGDYDGAQKLALDPTTAKSYSKLDSTLTQLIDATRATMRNYIQQGITASTFMSSMVLVLSILAVLSLWLGIRPRLQEYL